jgi:transcriptional regulator with XRE-family HTH domain
MKQVIRMLDGTQSRMARAALGWSLPDLADRTGLHVNTLSKFEGGSDAKRSTLEKLWTAYVKEGVEFPAPYTARAVPREQQVQQAA